MVVLVVVVGGWWWWWWTSTVEQFKGLDMFATTLLPVLHLGQSGFGLQSQTFLISAAKHYLVADTDSVATADDYVSVSVRLCGVHGSPLVVVGGRR